MKKRLQDAMKDAMRAKDKVRLNTIRGALSAIQYEEMRKGKELGEEEITAVLKTELKKRDEAIEYAEKDGRSDLRAELEIEKKALAEFLPEQMSAEQLAQLIQKMKEADPDIALGAVMKRLREEHSGRFDGKLASETAKRILG